MLYIRVHVWRGWHVNPPPLSLSFPTRAEPPSPPPPFSFSSFFLFLSAAPSANFIPSHRTGTDYTPGYVPVFRIRINLPQSEFASLLGEGGEPKHILVQSCSYFISKIPMKLTNKIIKYPWLKIISKVVIRIRLKMPLQYLPKIRVLSLAFIFIFFSRCWISCL